MPAITNTALLPRPGWLGGGDPKRRTRLRGRPRWESIEDQEKDGQLELCSGSQLPVGGRDDRVGAGEIPIHVHDLGVIWESLGINVIGVSIDDPLFYDVDLPDGWGFKAHAANVYWSDLVDPLGRVVAHVFYKAAFYERRAFARVQKVAR